MSTARRVIERLEETGALSVPASDLEAVADQFSEPSKLSISDELRQIVTNRYLNGSPAGDLLSSIAHLLDAKTSKGEPGGQPQH
jgi:hypothetical protein